MDWNFLHIPDRFHVDVDHGGGAEAVALEALTASQYTEYPRHKNKEMKIVDAMIYRRAVGASASAMVYCKERAIPYDRDLRPDFLASQAASL